MLLSALAVYCCIYLVSNYQFANESVSGIKVELNKEALDKGIPLLYTNRNNEAIIDLQKPYRFQKINDSVIILNGLEKIGLSKFRVYFEYPGNNFRLKKLTLFSKNLSKEITLNSIKAYEGIKKQDNLFFDVKSKNAFIEYPYILINKIPYLKIILGISFFVFILNLILQKTEILDLLFKIRKQDVLFSIFLFSIFLFAPLYNITLIIALIFYIRYFDWKLFKKNNINFLFVILFLVYLLNNIFISSNVVNEFSTVERLVPFVLIPVLMASVKFDNALYYLMLSALSIGFVLVATSLLDFIILGRNEYFSFKEFSNNYHPVYLSYLFFLVICFLQQYYYGKEKYFLQAIFFVLLIFLGSKLVLLVTLPLYLLFFFRIKRNPIVYIILGLIFLSSIFLFKPLQNRFSDILNFNDLSILKETKIHDSNDIRINGLTLRLILWKETIATMDGLDEFIFGNGVSKFKSKDLMIRLTKLGLIHHNGLNPHNQYIDTFWRTGFIGLLILMLIFIKALMISIKNKDKLLLIFTLFLMFGLVTESVFGRVRGVYFITTVLLILTNTNFHYEYKKQYS